MKRNSLQQQEMCQLLKPLRKSGPEDAAADALYPCLCCLFALQGQRCPLTAESRPHPNAWSVAKRPCAFNTWVVELNNGIQWQKFTWYSRASASVGSHGSLEPQKPPASWRNRKNLQVKQFSLNQPHYLWTQTDISIPFELCFQPEPSPVPAYSFGAWIILI